ncbi:hypothetical protein VNO80_06286 [Phaseolus coccineus]|uniref:Uncharacterized protein n=1 Tax=Phaseolus coccineus TaxID=3886 RepID=A0AAN9NHT5_PHACN
MTSEFLSNRRIEKLCHICLSEVQTPVKELCNLCYSRSVNNKNKKKNESRYCVATFVDMKEWFAHLTFNIIGKDGGGKELLWYGAYGGKGEGIKGSLLEVVGFGGYEKAMKETTEEMDKLLSEWLEEHREKKGLGGKVKGDGNFMDVMISTLNGAQIDGFDVDTICKTTTLE